MKVDQTIYFNQRTKKISGLTSFYPAAGGSLNNPANKKDKNAIFKAFGLDGDLDYEGNLKLSHEN
ncbi:hypothetical protein [Treponema denticola]|uniref:hypothetical protein n=1 Tax=Treponema denticola TaxID=158 RepID=UPI0020A57E01|nr:hypothetical protein [Treponema denticola]UTC81664.1 hypothetical protein HGJ18_01170 [Treponema denticola]